MWNFRVDSAPQAARAVIPGDPPEPASHTQTFGQGPAAFKSPVPHLPYPGPNPNISGDRALRFIPPLALFNDASQWVDRLYFNRPMPFNMNPDSNPAMRAQYFTPPPVVVSQAAAGNLNLQLQYGMIDIQAARLSEDASNWFGG